MRALEARIEELSDDNWELREAEERARSLLEAQGDLIVRRDADGRITYANDALCALAGRSREAHDRHHRRIAHSSTQGPVDGAARRHPRARPEDRLRPTAALDRLARSRGARRRPGAPKCRASAATSPIGSRPSARWLRRATRRRPPIAPSRASSPRSATKSARRSTAFSAWPICCSTPRSRPSNRLMPRRRRPQARRCCR